MDYIHTTSGQPVYFNTKDNFYDLKERFKPNIYGFRSLCGFDQEQVLIFVVDTGIYSLDVFKEIINSPGLHMVTWEKGYNMMVGMKIPSTGKAPSSEIKTKKATKNSSTIPSRTRPGIKSGV